MLTYVLLSAQGELDDKQKMELWESDSMQKAFDEGKYYVATHIRLESNDHAFIYVDHEYTDTVIQDMEIRQLFLATKLLMPGDRESFYSLIINSLPKEDLQIHKIIWALDEFRSETRNGDVGMYMLATWLVAKPTPGDPYYYIEARRNYFNRFGVSIPMGFMRVHGKTLDVEVMDMSEADYFPLRKFRKMAAGR